MTPRLSLVSSEIPIGVRATDVSVPIVATQCRVLAAMALQKAYDDRSDRLPQREPDSPTGLRQARQRANGSPSCLPMLRLSH